MTWIQLVSAGEYFCSEETQQRNPYQRLLRRTRQIVVHVIGDRSEATRWRLWERVPARYCGLQTCSNFWEAYQKVIS